MSEIEIIQIAAPGDAPDWFRKWATTTNYKLLKLNRSITAGLTIRENLSSRVVSAIVAHAKTTTLSHNLNRESDFITLGSGRVAGFQVITNAVNAATVKVWLICVPVTEISATKKAKFPVTDSSLFNVGDVVEVNGAERKITNIAGNEITLSDKVDLSKLRCVTLSRETVSFLIL